MALFDFFRRAPQIRDQAALADFIDRNAAFVVQKGIYEYSRARAGHYSKVLFGEPQFQLALEHSRWRAFPLGLAMLTELTDAVLHGESVADRRATLEAINTLTLSVFDRYPVPAALNQDIWRNLRADLARRLAQIALHPPKRSNDIPEPFAKSYFNLMPIHEKLRGRDFTTTRNYLRLTLINIHTELTKRADPVALKEALLTGGDQG
jgi:hypothetical protein